MTSDQQYNQDLDAWKADKAAVRTKKRSDGVPTRIDAQFLSDAEMAIRLAQGEVEAMGGSLALTEAVILLTKARDRVADHVEGDRK